MVPDFLLDSRLEADCLPICELELCRLLLMNDKRWPWLILVPRISNAVEIHDLEQSQQVLLMQETSRIADILMKFSNCEKINTGALGNIVRQLHVHVIARNAGDDNWPAPVWGYGTRQVYQREESVELVNTIRKHLA